MGRPPNLAIILPGLSDPERTEAYRSAYEFIDRAGRERGYFADRTLRYPGHHSGPWPRTNCTIHRAIEVTSERLAVAEASGVPYLVIARSLGAVVAIHLSARGSLPNATLRLWGPPSTRSINGLYANLDAFTQRCRQNRVTANESYFEGWPSVETNLPTVGTRSHVTSGVDDAYCGPDDLVHLAFRSRQNSLVTVYRPIPDVGHDVPPWETGNNRPCTVAADTACMYGSFLFDSHPRLSPIRVTPKQNKQ